MAITRLPLPTPAGVVGRACAELDAIAETLWSARTSDELVEGVEQLQRLKAKTAALEAHLLAEVEARGCVKTDLGWASAADWYTHVAGTSRRTGKRTVAQARLLVTDRSATLQGLSDGVVSPDQAAVVIDAVERLPGHGDLRARGEQALLEQTDRLNATDLHRTGRHLLHVVDPDGEDRRAERELEREERAAHLDRFLSVTGDGCGGVRIRGRGSVEDGAVLRAALLPLTRPVSAVDPVTCEEVPDPRDHGARTWDALIGLAQHALDTDLPPDSHGARPRVAVTLDLEHLKSSLGSASTDDGLDLSAGVVRRLACDADLVPVVLGTDSAVLDVGRTRRLITPPIWTALVARDRHCAFPACTRPPVMGHAHHITHWAHGGPTSLDNLVLVCGHHHRTLHHTPWQVRLATDGRPEFLPPPKAGRPPPAWTRHRARRE